MRPPTRAHSVALYGPWRSLTLTRLSLTYVTSCVPLYVYRRRHAEKRSTAPVSDPRASCEPSGFHWAADTT